MVADPFDRCVFLNCPFDDDYVPILQSILFCIVYLGLVPRIATERSDSAENRLSKIVELISSSRYSIHDVSRSQAQRVGEFYRLNMPFELGIDYGCREFGRGKGVKKILVLEEHRRHYLGALSDLAGCDVEVHDGKYDDAIRKVRNWLVNETGAKRVGASRIVGAYATFQEWYWEQQRAAGSSEDDIKKYPTSELLSSMKEWVALGEPT